MYTKNLLCDQVPGTGDIVATRTSSFLQSWNLHSKGGVQLVAKQLNDDRFRQWYLLGFYDRQYGVEGTGEMVTGTIAL